MDETQGGTDWTNFVLGLSDIGLTWYSTVTQKPIARQPTNSIMGALTGTDYGVSRPGTGSQVTNPIGGGLIMLAAIGAVGFYFLSRR